MDTGFTVLPGLEEVVLAEGQIRVPWPCRHARAAQLPGPMPRSCPAGPVPASLDIHAGQALPLPTRTRALGASAAIRRRTEIAPRRGPWQLNSARRQLDMIQRRHRSLLAGVQPWLACAALALAGCGGGGTAAPGGGPGPAADASTLTVAAGANGSVAVELNSTAAVTVAAGPSMDFSVAIADAVTLTAQPAAGHAFARWTLSGGLPSGFSCATATCALTAGSITGDASASATFGRATSTLTVSAGAGGSVSVEVGESPAVTVVALASTGLTATVADAIALTATPASGYAFTVWTLSDGLSCAEGRTSAACTLAAGQVTASGSASAAFRIGSFAVSWTGPGAVRLDGGTIATAVPYAPGAFIGWTAGPCAGSTALACDASAASSSAVAAFRPFTVAGIKALAFGLGYNLNPQPAHYMVSGQPRAGFGFTVVPGLERIVPAQGQTSTTLALSLHALRWDGSQSYLTEACYDGGRCVLADGALDALARARLLGAVGYFKAPNAEADDEFGTSIALSADGATLAVGAPFEDSSVAGAFHPGDASYAAALASSGASSAGAAYVYRRSSNGQWRLEAYVKAPNAGVGDRFGSSVALSADGATLAVGATEERSSAVGIFQQGDMGYGVAVTNDDLDPLSGSGAAYVYRRSASRWSIEAYVKAPNAGERDGFGASLALSSSGDTLAVGADFEDSAAAGALHPGDAGYAAATADNDATGAGAAYVYRRSSTDQWSVDAYVKAPNAEEFDGFGASLALSSSGDTLAVGADFEESAAAGVFHPGDADYAAALADNAAAEAGAAYAYRRSSTGQWRVDAYVKAPNAGELDGFGFAVALSSSGDTLAVGADFEESFATGAFHPGDAGYAGALADNSAFVAGAAYVYRRSSTGQWRVEAYVKAPNTERSDQFGRAVALSADGATLAVGADFEESSATGAFHPRDAGYAAATADHAAPGAGAAYIYRRSDADQWSVGAYVKAPNAEEFDGFGFAVALSSSGATLAVGASFESGAGRMAPEAWAFSNESAKFSGAVYLY